MRASGDQANHALSPDRVRRSRVGQIWFKAADLHALYPRVSRLLAHEITVASPLCIDDVTPPIPPIRKMPNMKNPPSTSIPIRNKFRSSRRNAIPYWENNLSTAIGEGLTASGAFEWSSVTRNNLTFTGEFELPGGMLVRFKSHPSPRHWGAVDISIVVEPHPQTNLNNRPQDVLSIMTPKGLRQGQVTAMSTIHFGDRGTPYIALLCVNRAFPKRWQRVCGL